MPIFLLIAAIAAVVILFLTISGIVGITRRQPWGPILLGVAALLGVVCALGLAVILFGARLYY